MNSSSQMERQALGKWFQSTRTALRPKPSAQAIADLVGVSQSTVAKWENEGMSWDVAKRYTDALGWEMPPLDFILSKHANVAEEDGAFLTISSLSPAAGEGSYNEYEILNQVKVPTNWVQAQYPNIKSLSNLALCQPRGDSMEPTFTSHDTLVIDRSVCAFDADAVYVFTYMDELRIKRIQREFDRSVTVISDNPLYDKARLGYEQLGDVIVHGKVVGKWAYSKV